MSNVLTETGLNKDAVLALSGQFNDPDWMREKREAAFLRYEALDMPNTRYTKIRGLDLDAFRPFSPFEGELNLAAAPEMVRTLLEEKTADDAYAVQVDSSIIKLQAPQALADKGVIFCDLHTAVTEHGDLIKEYLMQDLFKLQTKMEALHTAFWSGGMFLYVPKGVELDAPLHTLVLHNSANAGLFTHTLIVAEAQSKVTYLEENYTLDRKAPLLHTAGIEVWAKDGAHVQVGGIQNWNEQTFSFGTRRARVMRDATVDWTFGWLGGRMTMAHLSNELAGQGAECTDVQMSYSHRKQHFDVSSNLVHQVPDTNGEVRVRNVLRDKSRSVFSGLIRIEEGAQRSNAYQSQRALILNEGARNDASPSLEINANDVRCTHAASASQLDDERLFYLRSRGLNLEQAKKSIVDGFFQPTVDSIQMPVARERLEKLIDDKWDSDEI
jgi:Fe-S cluster assembly protein SufD